MTIGKTAAELAALVMDQVRSIEACSILKDLRVSFTDDPEGHPNWHVVASEGWNDGLLPDECTNAVRAVEAALQNEYHLLPEREV